MGRVLYVFIIVGEMIGIDFGMAFGTATSTLSVPELVPCRLTKLFENLIPALGFHGIIFL